MKSTVLTTLLASASLYHTTSASCAHGTFLHRRVEGEIAAPSFGYTGTIGPLNWANLKAENSACNTGSRQSPINLAAATIAHDAGSAYKLTIADLPNGAEFENLGTTVEVLVNGTLETPLKNYAMRQFHFHTPSEHRVEEEFFSIESHFVFESEGVYPLLPFGLLKTSTSCENA
jgi:carbonic anhydrase